jgi:hypothetical protein
VSPDPDFRDVIGGDLPPAEEARLRRVHELLIQAGPPPELPPSLAEAPSEQPRGELVGLPRRRTLAGLVLAAALALIAFGGGYLLGHRSGGGFETAFTLPMHGTVVAPRATAALELGEPAASGNIPLRMVVQGLPKLPKDGYYELWLTRGNQEIASCGTFRVANGDQVTVVLNAPYLIPRGEHPGWIVVAHVPGREAARPLLTT